MRKLLLLGLISIIGHSSNAQTNATDVTITDCNGTTVNLFSELDAGKIIVIGWTMPCNTCGGPLSQIHDAVLNFAGSNPGVVEYWINDDYANSPCTTIEAWSQSYGITNARYFSDGQLNMNDYGGAGMPKVVVLGCTDHKVYYNKNNNPYGPHVTAAIQTALDDIANNCLSLGIEDSDQDKISINCFPVPVEDKLTVQVDGISCIELQYELIGVNGSQHNIVLDKSLSTSEVTFSVSHLNAGVYFLKISNENFQTVKRIEIF